MAFSGPNISKRTALIRDFFHMDLRGNCTVDLIIIFLSRLHKILFYFLELPRAFTWALYLVKMLTFEIFM